MSKRIKESDLSSKISAIINTAPDYGEEDDDFTKTAQLVNEEPLSDSGDELNLSQFRKINIELLDAEDKKYSGIRGSRRDVEKEKAFGSDSSDCSDNEIDTGSTKSVDDVEDGDADPNEEDEDEDEESVSFDDIDSDSDNDDVEVSEQDEIESDSYEGMNEVNQISAKVSSDIEKGHAIRNQFGIWDSLLECRIKFQKCLTVANKLPQRTKFSKFKELGGEEFVNAQKLCQATLKNVLNSMMTLQKNCIDVNTKHFENSTKRSLSDDEIPSDSDENSKEEGVGYHKEKKRRKLIDFSHDLSESHASFIQFRNDTIQRWNDKTRVSQMGSKDFSAFEQSTLKQIEMVLADKQRLLKKTRTKRSNYHILGEEDEGPPSKVLKNDESSEIFDDDDFYHQLLRELLERKSSDVTDPVQLSRQWIQLQKARSKMKKSVDTKASKGRKLRYGVHQKIVNFMMPIDNTSWSDDARTELVGSLFGKKIM